MAKAPTTSAVAAATLVGVIRVDTISLAKCDISGKVALDFEDGVRVPLARIYGKAIGIKSTTNRTTGETMDALKGEFRCENFVNGKTYKSAVCYLLQGGSQDVVQNPLEKADIAGKSIEVPFAVDYFATAKTIGEGDKARRVYDFDVEFLNEPAETESDPLAELAGSLPERPVMPTKAEAPVADPAA